MVPPAKGHLRKFGLVVGGVFLGIAAWTWWHGRELAPPILLGIGGPLVVLALIAPSLLAPVERVWLSIANVLGHVNTTLILALFYFLVFAPVGFIRRQFSDPLNLKPGPGKDSYWVRREPSEVNPDRYRQQF